MATGWYVMVRSGKRRGLLYGPVDTQERAAGMIEQVRDVAATIDTWAWGYEFGTAKVTVAPSKGLPVGRLNKRMGLEASG